MYYSYANPQHLSHSYSGIIELMNHIELVLNQNINFHVSAITETCASQHFYSYSIDAFGSQLTNQWKRAKEWIPGNQISCPILWWCFFLSTHAGCWESEHLSLVIKIQMYCFLSHFAQQTITHYILHKEISYFKDVTIQLSVLLFF